MKEPKPEMQARIAKQIDEVKATLGKEIVALLRQVNAARLASKGKVTATPIVDRASLRWVLAWEQDKISYDLNVVVRFDDDGQRARVAGVWVHRHASTPMEYEGHTPTTRMHRLTGLAIKEIKEAIDAEWG
jgi:hypothetical protein